MATTPAPNLPMLTGDEVIETARPRRPRRQRGAQSDRARRQRGSHGNSTSIRSARRSGRSSSSTRRSSRSRKRGLVVRARHVQGREHDSVVKSRPVDPATLRKQLRKSPDFGVEVDAMPGGFVCSASLKGLVEGDAIRKTAFRDPSDPQAVLEAPACVLRRTHAGGARTRRSLGYGSDPRAETQMAARRAPEQDGCRAVDLSRRLAHPRALHQVRAGRPHLDHRRHHARFLHRRDVELSAVQATKTKTTLEFFSHQLRTH